MKTNKTKLVTAIAAATIIAAPQMASAHKVSKKSVKAAASSSHAISGTESRLQQMEAELASLRAEVAKNRSEAKSEIRANADKDAVTQASVEEKLAKAEEDKDGEDTLFFRGGYAKMEHARNNELLTGHDLLSRAPRDGEGWYVGAGIDHQLTKNLWGLSDLASVDGEVMFEYKNYGHSTNTLVNVAGNAVTQGAVGTIRNQVTQFTLTAAPKVKFNTGTIFTPWVIPFGLGIHVISPPSSGVTVLNPGLMVGAGGEIALIKSLVAGFDFRYHFTGNDLSYKSSTGALNKTDTDGFTTGAYLGFKF